MFVYVVIGDYFPGSMCVVLNAVDPSNSESFFHDLEIKRF